MRVPAVHPYEQPGHLKNQNSLWASVLYRHSDVKKVTAVVSVHQIPFCRCEHAPAAIHEKPGTENESGG